MAIHVAVASLMDNIMETFVLSSGPEVIKLCRTVIDCGAQVPRFKGLRVYLTETLPMSITISH